MSQLLPAVAPGSAVVPGAPGPTGQPAPRLEADAQFLVFEPGLYAVDLAAAAEETGTGLRLPVLRLDPVASARHSGRCVVSFAATGGWLSDDGPAAYVLVVGGQAGAVLTVYRRAGGLGPEIRIRALGIPEAQGANPIPPAAPSAAASKIPMTALAHVRTLGDVTAAGEAWAGRPGSGHPMEGFSVSPGGPLGLADIEYQAVLGHNWTTPWFSGGQFCGSRGLALPLLGLRARLVGAAAERFTLRCWASFVGAGAIGPIEDGGLCAVGDAALEAVRFAVVPRAA